MKDFLILYFKDPDTKLLFTFSFRLVISYFYLLQKTKNFESGKWTRDILNQS